MAPVLAIVVTALLLSSFAVILLLQEGVIRRFRSFRLLFGLRPL